MDFSFDIGKRAARKKGKVLDGWKYRNVIQLRSISEAPKYLRNEKNITERRALFVLWSPTRNVALRCHKNWYRKMRQEMCADIFSAVQLYLMTEWKRGDERARNDFSVWLDFNDICNQKPFIHCARPPCSLQILLFSPNKLFIKY